MIFSLTVSFFLDMAMGAKGIGSRPIFHFKNTKDHNPYSSTGPSLPF